MSASVTTFCRPTSPTVERPWYTAVLCRFGRHAKNGDAGPSQYRTTFPLWHPAPKPYSRCMWKTRLAIIAVVGGTLAGLAVLFYIVLPVLRSEAPPKIADTPNLVLQVQGLSQFVTVKYVMEKVVKLESEPALYGLHPGDRIIIIAHADVKAGVDLAQISPDDIKVSNKKISLTIPPGKILDCYLDEKYTQVWEHKLAIFRKFDPHLRSE